jgi:hypothetical protein
LTANDRIRRCAQAVAEQLGGNHLRYMEIVAVVLYADESTNWLNDWNYILDAEAKSAAIEGAKELRERLAAKLPVDSREAA